MTEGSCFQRFKICNHALVRFFNGAALDNNAGKILGSPCAGQLCGNASLATAHQINCILTDIRQCLDKIKSNGNILRKILHLVCSGIYSFKRCAVTAAAVVCFALGINGIYQRPFLSYSGGDCLVPDVCRSATAVGCNDHRILQAFIKICRVIHSAEDIHAVFRRIVNGEIIAVILMSIAFLTCRKVFFSGRRRFFLFVGNPVCRAVNIVNDSLHADQRRTVCLVAEAVIGIADQHCGG